MRLDRVIALVLILCASVSGAQTDISGVSGGQGQQEIAAAENRAVDAVSAVAGEALRIYQSPPRERLPELVQLVERSTDWGFVLRNTVPPALVSALSDGERRDLSESLLKVTAQSYAAAFQAYQGEVIDVLSVNTIGPGVACVGTRLRGGTVESDISLDWIVADLGQNRLGLRDLIIDNTSMLASQQLNLETLWSVVEEDKAEFLRRLALPDPWEE
ncbi:ABC transporter substrate-binding protein [uncultured Tateyamaria sp.]|uniref:ABC transporter substrate-binding protein n=1 Tax=uncultured Tateyamaria sp. TaxID=455651 RepID=UPI002636C131|nr:ABC transporter substrate-binding protein [uncultured Tateyamaria sp.]